MGRAVQDCQRPPSECLPWRSLLPLAVPTHSKGSVLGTWVKAELGVPEGQLASH